MRINRPKPDQQVGRDSPWVSHAAIGGKPPPTSNALQVEYLADETRSNVGGGLPPMGPAQSIPVLQTHRYRGVSSYLIGIQVEARETAQSAITTIATRRFSVRPAAVSFDATGWLLPKPRSWMFSSFIPTLVSTVATLLARRRESCSL